MPNASPGASPAAYFGLPGITRPIEVKENNDGSVVSLSQTAAVNHTGLVPLKQTDVIQGWEFTFSIAQTTAAGTQTINLSPYFPYNFVGGFTLNFQSQFDSIKALSGIDLAIWQLIRPQRPAETLPRLYSTLVGVDAYSVQANQISSSSYTAASTSLKFRLQVPAGIWFDAFYPLTVDGDIQGPAVRAFVSPQYMAGSARIVQPSITYNPAFAATYDQGPYVVTGTPTTPATFSAATATINLKRRGWYAPMGPADSPPVWNWQYTRRATLYSIGAVASKDFLVPLNGQILSIFLRLFDPSLNAGAGGVIPLANVKEVDVLYGSGLYRFQDTIADAQARFAETHNGTVPPEGVYVADFATDDFGRVTNAGALNTLTTSSIIVHVDFTGTQSTSSYVVVGVEALTYVEAG